MLNKYYKEPSVRVLARIFKMPLWNCNHKMTTRPDLATLLQILILTTLNRPFVQKWASYTFVMH